MEPISSNLDFPAREDPVRRLPALEEALELRKTMKLLENELERLDALGADLAAAHLARALDALHERFNSNLNVTRMDAPGRGNGVLA